MAKDKNGSSIEEELEKVLKTILQENISLQAASRTDAGVHAKGQIVNFLTSQSNLNFNRLFLSINQLLPKDIVVLNLEKVSENFHPTLDCKGKEYHYTICASPIQLPHHRHYSWHISCLLDLSKMTEAANMLLGRQNFKALCNMKKNSRYSDYERELISIDIETLPDQRILIAIKGNLFLYKMARNIAGMIVYAGVGKVEPTQIKDILASGNRSEACVTAPAHGLALARVFY